MENNDQYVLSEWAFIQRQRRVDMEHTKNRLLTSCIVPLYKKFKNRTLFFFLFPLFCFKFKWKSRKHDFHSKGRHKYSLSTYTINFISPVVEEVLCSLTWENLAIQQCRNALSQVEVLYSKFYFTKSTKVIAKNCEGRKSSHYAEWPISEKFIL